MFNLTGCQPDIDKMYLYAKYPNKAKCQLLIDKREGVGFRECNYSKAFIEYSNDIDEIYENIEEYNAEKKWKRLIVFDGMIADILSNKKLNPIVTELFIGGAKLNISLALLHSYISPYKKKKKAKIQKKAQKLQTKFYTVFYYLKLQTNGSFNKSHLIFHQLLDLKTLWIFTKNFTSKPYSFLLIDTTLASGNSLCFRKNFLARI